MVHIHSPEREKAIKVLLDRYCKYLFDLPTKDIEGILEAKVFTFADAILKQKD